MKKLYIPCMCCGKEHTLSWLWMVCNQCGYRICLDCLGKHKNRNGVSPGLNAASVPLAS